MPEVESTPEEKAHEAGYAEGRRRTLINLLSHALKELRGFDKSEDADLITVAQLTTERQEALQVLRRACRDFGDNEWPDNLHLADIIDKHLVPYLRDGS